MINLSRSSEVSDTEFHEIHSQAAVSMSGAWRKEKEGEKERERDATGAVNGENGPARERGDRSAYS